MLTEDGTNTRLYVDGVRDGADGASSNVTGTTLNIGRYTGGFTWDGWIDEVAIYPSTLTPSQIAVHYNLGTLGYNPLALRGVDGSPGRSVYAPTVHPTLYKPKRGAGGLGRRTWNQE